MDLNTEIRELTGRIPNQSKYDPSAQLQVSLPTNSLISPAKALQIIHEYAYHTGWEPERIAIIRIGGYIQCNDCKRSLHIHVATDNANYCMNCEHLNSRRVTYANVRIIEG